LPQLRGGETGAIEPRPVAPTECDSRQQQERGAEEDRRADACVAVAEAVVRPAVTTDGSSVDDGMARGSAGRTFQPMGGRLRAPMDDGVGPRIRRAVLSSPHDVRLLALMDHGVGGIRPEPTDRLRLHNRHAESGDRNDEREARAIS
jgi:hypothetical protein